MTDTDFKDEWPIEIQAGKTVVLEITARPRASSSSADSLVLNLVEQTGDTQQPLTAALPVFLMGEDGKEYQPYSNSGGVARWRDVPPGTYMVWLDAAAPPTPTPGPIALADWGLPLPTTAQVKHTWGPVKDNTRLNDSREPANDLGVKEYTDVLAVNHGRVATVHWNPNPKPWNDAGKRADQIAPGFKLPYDNYTQTHPDGRKFSGFGNYVVIHHYADVSSFSNSTPYSRRSLYGHLHDIDVREGQWVRKGQVIGISGGDQPTRRPGYTYFKPFGPDGTATGPHLHFEGELTLPDAWK